MTDDGESAPRGEPRGFRGVLERFADADEALSRAAEEIARATGCSDAAVGAFLGSRYGRMFGEEVVTLLDRGLSHAIADVVASWMGRAIGERIEDELGIPAGLPCLRGLVLMHGALLDLGYIRSASGPVALVAWPASRLEHPATE